MYPLLTHTLIRYFLSFLLGFYKLYGTSELLQEGALQF